jgi:predicted transcriptional regulator
MPNEKEKETFCRNRGGNWKPCGKSHYEDKVPFDDDLSSKKSFGAEETPPPSIDIFYIQPDRKSISDELTQRGVKGRQFSHGEQFFNFLYLPDKMTNFPTKIKARLEKYFEYLITTTDQTLGIYDTDLKVFSCSDFQVKYLKRGHLRHVYFELIDDKFIKEVSLDSDDLPPYFKHLFNKTELIESYMIESEEPNRDRHYRLEELLLNDIDNVFAVEPPVFNKSVSIAGHIDFLSFKLETEKFRLQINDYKPVEAGREYEFVKFLPQLCMYALILNRTLNFTDSDLLECVMFNRYKAIIFKPNLIKFLPEILAPHYNLARFGQDSIDFLGNVRDYLYLDWALLSGLESFYQLPMDQFDTIKLELLNALNLDLGGNVNDIALNLNDIVFALKGDLSSITPEQSDYLDIILASTQILLNQSIKSDDLFFEFFQTYKFDLDIWETSLPSSYLPNLEPLLNIYKLKIIFLRLKFRTAGYQYYTLVALYSLEKATGKQLAFILKSYFAISNLYMTGISSILTALIRKDLIKKSINHFYILTPKGEYFLSNVNVKKDFNILIERNKLLLKKRPYAFQILRIFHDYYGEVKLNSKIISEIHYKIKDPNNNSIRLPILKSNIEFLKEYNFFTDDCKISNSTKKILNELNIDNNKILPSDIKFINEILVVIYSMDYPRYSYINQYLESLNIVNYNRSLLDISLELLLSINYILKEGNLHSLTKKGLSYIKDHDLEKKEQLRLYSNINEFKRRILYAPYILDVINQDGEINKSNIQKRVPSVNSIFGLITISTVSKNIKILENMGYVKAVSNKYMLTASGKDLFKIPDFQFLLEQKNDSELLSKAKIEDIPHVNEILQLIVSIKKARFNYIKFFANEWDISYYYVKQALNFLKTSEYLKVIENIYILTIKGQNYVKDNNIQVNYDIYIKSLNS